MFFPPKKIYFTLYKTLYVVLCCFKSVKMVQSKRKQLLTAICFQFVWWLN